MQTKPLTILAVISVVVLVLALVVAMARNKQGVDTLTNRVPREYNVPPPRPSDGTVTGASAQTSVEVQADNIKTSVQVP